MEWDETIVETISIFYIFVCSIKVEVYVTFLYEGSIYTQYGYILCVCRGLCKPPSSYDENFKFSQIFQTMNVMT